MVLREPKLDRSMYQVKKGQVFHFRSEMALKAFTSIKQFCVETDEAYTEFLPATNERALPKYTFIPHRFTQAHRWLDHPYIHNLCVSGLAHSDARAYRTRLTASVSVKLRSNLSSDDIDPDFSHRLLIPQRKDH